MIEKMKAGLREASKWLRFKLLYPLVYYIRARKPVDKQLVVFADLLHSELPDNLAAIWALCRENGYRCVFWTAQLDRQRQGAHRGALEKLKHHLEFMKLFAQCGVLCLSDWFPYAYLVKARAETQVVQLWHGCGAMKMFGYSTDDKPWGETPEEKKRYPSHVNYSLACVSGAKAVAPFEDAFRCGPGVVRALGVPRTDVFFDPSFRDRAKQKLLEKYPEIGTRKVVLYAPTYRGNSMDESHLDIRLDFHELERALSSEYVLLLRLHPSMKIRETPATEGGQLQSFLFDGSDGFSAAESLCAADILITDYSSIAFEYLLLERPVISYIYDIEAYIRDRGFYYPYEETLPGPYVYDQETLIERLRTVPQWFDAARVRRYKEEFMSACDGHSTQRIYSHIFHSRKKEA